MLLQVNLGPTLILPSPYRRLLLLYRDHPVAVFFKPIAVFSPLRRKYHQLLLFSPLPPPSSYHCLFHRHPQTYYIPPTLIILSLVQVGSVMIPFLTNEVLIQIATP